MTRGSSARGLLPWRVSLRKYRYFYLMLIPAVLYYLLFHYWPMYGVTMAFKDYIPARGLEASDWVGLKHFFRLFTSREFKRVFANTVVISLYKLAICFPAPILVALLLNEITNKAFKKTIQTVLYLPHFVSWVVVAGILYRLTTVDGGLLNAIVELFGGEPILFMADKNVFRGVLVTTELWKATGWSTIIYLAALAGIDVDQYESAVIDGANRLQKMVYITLPSIKSTIVVLLILAVGNMMNAGFNQILALYNPSVYEVADIIDTYVFRAGLQGGQYSFATAAGVFKSAISFALIVGTNLICRAMGEEGLF